MKSQVKIAKTLDFVNNSAFLLITSRLKAPKTGVFRVSWLYKYRKYYKKKSYKIACCAYFITKKNRKISNIIHLNYHITQLNLNLPTVIHTKSAQQFICFHSLFT